MQKETIMPTNPIALKGSATTFVISRGAVTKYARPPCGGDIELVTAPLELVVVVTVY